MRIMLTRILKKYFRTIFYSFITIMVIVSAYTEYQTWLNPLGLKPEENPKQHDGSQEFTPPREWKSSVEPMPDEEGVRRYLDPWELWQHGSESESEVDK